MEENVRKFLHAGWTARFDEIKGHGYFDVKRSLRVNHRARVNDQLILRNFISHWRKPENEILVELLSFFPNFRSQHGALSNQSINDIAMEFP